MINLPSFSEVHLFSFPGWNLKLEHQLWARCPCPTSSPASHCPLGQGGLISWDFLALATTLFQQVERPPSPVWLVVSGRIWHTV